MKSLEELLNDDQIQETPVTGENLIESVNQREMKIPDYIIDDPEVVGYPDEKMQWDIYNWVSKSIPNPEATVKDFGCGRGDFGHDWVRSENYIGIDRTPVIINAGKKKYPGLDLRLGDWFDCNDVTDHTVCIGSLNSNNGQDEWEYLADTLDHAIATSNISVIFILNRKTELDGYVEYPIGKLLDLLNDDLPFEIDYSKFEDIYKLVVYCKPFEV